MVVRRSMLLFFALLVGSFAQWTPEPAKYNVPLASPAPNGKKTQLSLYPPNGPVVVMAGSDVTTMNKSMGAHAGHPVIVAMYAAWCPHCQHLVPAWVRLAEAFAGQTEVEIAAVNCADAANRDACDAAGVSAIPDIQCYGCPVSKKCPGNGCTISVGIPQGVVVPHWIAKWLSDATSGAVKPSHPELLDFAEPAAGKVVINGPPGKPGFIPSMFLSSAKRDADAMRGFLSALWTKNDAQAALTAVDFLVSLFGPSCCHSGGMPDGLRSTTFLGLRRLSTSLASASDDTRTVLQQWATAHGVHDLGNQETFATFKKGVLSPGGQDSFNTCTTFTCSLWQFLHMLTASAAYFAEAGSPRLSPGAVMKFARYFVSEFLTCAACRQHFLVSYDGCEFNRCTVNQQTDWQGLVLWLWRLHQGVSLRTAARDHAPVDRRWPSYEDCEGCWQPLMFQERDNVNAFDMLQIGNHSAQIDKSFKLPSVYQFIVASYVGWTAEEAITKGTKATRLWDQDATLENASNGSKPWLWWSFSAVSVVGTIALFSLWRRKTEPRHSGETHPFADEDHLNTLTACE